MAGEVSPQTVADAETELDKVRDDWLGRPGVRGVDVGLDRRGEGGVAVRVYVERKLPREELPQPEVFPERLGRFPVEVREASFGLEQR